MTNITVILNMRSLDVQVYKEHLSDAELRTLGEIASGGRPISLYMETPDTFHIHSATADHLHLLIFYRGIVS